MSEILKKKICFVSYGSISFDPRLQKTTEILTAAGADTVVLAKRSNNAHVHGFNEQVTIRLLDSKVQRWIKPSQCRIWLLRVAWNLLVFNPISRLRNQEENIENVFLNQIKKEKANVVVFINYYTNKLQDAYTPCSGQQIYYETYEYYPTYFRNKLHNIALLSDEEAETLQGYEIRAMRNADKAICVSEEIAARYESEYVCRRPAVVYNCPLADSLPPRPVGRQLAFYLQTGLRINYGIETIIEAFSRLTGDFSLTIQGRDLLGGYIAELRQLIEKFGLEKKVFVKDPCGYDKVVEEANKYDVGISALPLWVNGVFEENHYLSLPNKFFVYATAGLAQIIGNHPSMIAATHGYDMYRQFKNGDPTNLAVILQNLIDNPTQVSEMKAQACLWSKQYGSHYLKETIRNLYL